MECNQAYTSSSSLILQTMFALYPAIQEYAQVIRMLGNGRLEAQCIDGKKRLCHIRGKMRKKVWVAQHCKHPVSSIKTELASLASGDILMHGQQHFQTKKDSGCVRHVTQTCVPLVCESVQGDIVLLGLREYQDEKADVIMKYTADEARVLKQYGELPEHIRCAC
eukprot:1137916-Pelagomonas_calceolata.AAC.3